MDFELSDDQLALADGVRRLCAGRLPLERLRAVEGNARTVDSAMWEELAGAGVFALRVPETDGGLGLGLAEAAVVFEELGRALVPGPLVATSLAATLGLAVSGSSGDAAPVVGSVRRGAPSAEDTPVLVEHLESLDALVVVTDAAGGGGPSLAVLDPRVLDATPAGRSLDPLTPMSLVCDLPAGDPFDAGPGGAPGTADAASLWVRDEEVLTGSLCVGLAAATLDLAVEYAKRRQQFGRPIGSFQAVKHLCADMLVRVETARAAVHAAAVTVDQPEVGDASRAAAGAALLAGEAAVANARACIQVHGGMGFTWEVPAHLYLMRAQDLTASVRSRTELARHVAARL